MFSAEYVCKSTASNFFFHTRISCMNYAKHSLAFCLCILRGTYALCSKHSVYEFCRRRYILFNAILRVFLWTRKSSLCLNIAYTIYIIVNFMNICFHINLWITKHNIHGIFLFICFCINGMYLKIFIYYTIKLSWHRELVRRVDVVSFYFRNVFSNFLILFSAIFKIKKKCISIATPNRYKVYNT